ncbi:hypothetical protein CLV84_2699 [Neolewinella xylanilytica]|uniref:Uncharacterized protein n=1 Tax=Neolewinella xylanilytica TaxID=1514080 RepID=A0A2S6I3M8_9BACT|nr:hypothetical protein [Neolewinella xylanilytica]PPK85792.1 hypothetical protein CLV84_2699 [Neolewinella xylanilytica]
MKYLKRPATLLAASTILLLSSCNRGYGCPGSNFSVDDFVSALITLLV